MKKGSAKLADLIAGSVFQNKPNPNNDHNQLPHPSLSTVVLNDPDMPANSFFLWHQ